MSRQACPFRFVSSRGDLLIFIFGRGRFFFFKQKTAYEMVMSDWSSDVCSSDLKRTGTETGTETGPGSRRARRRRVAAATGEGGFRGGRERPPRCCASAPPEMKERNNDGRQGSDPRAAALADRGRGGGRGGRRKRPGRDRRPRRQIQGHQVPPL